MRKPITFLAVFFAVLALGSVVAAQSPASSGPPPRVVIVGAHWSNAVDGATLYQAYCASCHGPAGRGNGPAAHAVPTPVPDLTRYSESHKGNCCLSVLAELQTGHRGPGQPKVSEQDLDMPNWQPIFVSMSSNNPGAAQLRLINVSKYVATLQAQK